MVHIMRAQYSVIVIATRASIDGRSIDHRQLEQKQQRARSLMRGGDALGDGYLITKMVIIKMTEGEEG